MHMYLATYLVLTKILKSVTAMRRALPRSKAARPGLSQVGLPLVQPGEGEGGDGFSGIRAEEQQGPATQEQLLQKGDKRDCSMSFLKLGFFHQTTPPGPIGGSLEPFLILAIFQISNFSDSNFKITPRRPGRQGAENRQYREYRGV